MKAAAPYRSVRLGSTDVTVRRESNGNIYVLSRQSLGPYPEKMTERLDHWADHAPNRVFMANTHWMEVGACSRTATPERWLATSARRL